MPTYKLHHKQIAPISLEEAWAFFSNPSNLKDITPPYMGFEILSDPADQMYQGQIIEYNVRPVLGIPLYWMTEITAVKENAFFIDEQRFGPYSLWHHQHFFSKVENGIEIEDIVHYRLPLGILGSIAHGVFVKKQLEGIFQFRAEYIKKKWP